jgi:dTDP-glucose 4,6-dehydratase
MTTRILITGAGGFVGHHLFEHILANTDWQVVVTDSFRHKGKTDRISEVLEGHDRGPLGWWDRTTVITHDLLAPFSEQTIAKMGPIDYIASVASESHVDRSITDPVPFVKNNVDIVLNTLELARQVKPKSYMLVSTDEVYGPVLAEDEHGHPEWDAILPSNPYAGSKAAQEAIAISYWRTYQVPLQIVNCMNMIGERQDTEKFIPKVISRTYRGEQVTIHGTPGHIGTRHYLHARNLADAMLFLFKNKTPAQFGENDYDGHIARPDRFNVASPAKIDNLTLAQMIAEYVGRPLRYELVDFHATRPGHDPHYGLDSGALTKLGWKLPVPFEDSLERTVEWTLNHPEWM